MILHDYSVYFMQLHKLHYVAVRMLCVCLTVYCVVSPGVATFVRDTSTPCRAEDGLSSDHCSMEDQIGCYSGESEFTTDELAKLDGEGRCVITEHQIRLVLCECL